MIRERLGRTALRAYPREIRTTRGDEMLGTLLDASERSVGAFARESALLGLSGVRERARVTARAGRRRLIADACCQATVILLVFFLRNGVHSELADSGDTARWLVAFVVLMGLLVCVLVGYDRIAGVCGVVLTAGALVLADRHAPLLQRSEAVALLLVPLACFAVMALAPRARARDPRRLLWLIPVGVLAAILPFSNFGSLEFLGAISLAALVVLPADPRFAIGCGLAWTALALSDGTLAISFVRVQWIPTAAGALMMLTAAAARLHAIKRTPQT